MEDEIIMQCSLGGVREMTHRHTDTQTHRHTHTDGGVTAINNIDVLIIWLVVARANLLQVA